MDFIETLLAKIMTEDPNKLTSQELQIASLFELRAMKNEIVSVKNEMISLNDKIDKTAEDSKLHTLAIETKYDKKFIDLEARVRLNEESRLERTITQKIISYVPHIAGVIVSAIVIYDYIKGHK